MHHLKLTDLPFAGMSHRFTGNEQGDVAVSAYLAHAPESRGSVLHTHPYDTIAFVLSGTGRWTVDGESQDVSPGDIVVVRAGSAHQFVNTGKGNLEIIDIHVNPTIEQTNV
ncbi:MAG: cupin domain-containing protein [Rhodothermales bacterium]